MLFFDWDGTLVNLWPRYYRVFCELTGATEISIEQYKNKKRLLVRDNIVAAVFGLKLPVGYFERKAQMLEEPEFLALDTLWLGYSKTKELFLSHDAMVLTKRRRPENLIAQMEQLGVRFPVAIVGEETKKEWIEYHCPDKESYIIGDYITDLEAAVLPNITAIMVGYGLGTQKQFDQCNVPYIFLSSAEALFETVKNIRLK